MTILSISGATTGAMLQQPLSSQASLEVPSHAGEANLLPEFMPPTQPAPGVHAAPVSPPETTTALPGEIVAGDTPGDEILAGLNKRWTRFSKALGTSLDHPVGSARDAADPSARDAMKFEPMGEDATSESRSGPTGRTTSRSWSMIDDGDYDAHVDRMAELEALQQHVRDMDDGGALTLQLSKTVQSLTSSVKTLVTGQ